MGAIITALDTVTARIQEALDNGIDVQDHPGRFTREELGRIALKPRNVRVSVEALPELSQTGHAIGEADVVFTAVAICSDTRGSDRHRAALGIVEDLIRLVPNNRWEAHQIFRAVQPKNIAADNLYSGDIDGKGIAMWAVSWQQTIRTQQE